VSIVGEEHVLGFEITVDDALHMGCRKTVAELHGVLKCLPQWKLSSPQSITEGLPLQ
jgi:hypothetical protein